MRTHSDRWIPVCTWSLPCYLHWRPLSLMRSHRPTQALLLGARPAQHAEPGSLTNDLIYHGGNCGFPGDWRGTAPAIYLIFWGPDWANGFTTTDANGGAYTSQVLQSMSLRF